MAEGMTYVRMLLDILVKKEQHLEKILEYTTEQEQLLLEKTFDEEAFAKLIERKGGLLKRIEEFDNGFDSIYHRVEEELKQNREAYKEQVLQMQELIPRVTDLGVRLETLEKKNRSYLEIKLREKKQDIRQFKVSKKTANKYYKSVLGIPAGMSYFVDQKK